MKFIPALSEQDRTALEQLHHDGPAHRPRQRAQAILLSARGYTVEQLADLFQTHRDTVSGWLSAWQDKGLDGLTDAPKAGRTPKIDAVIKDYLHEMLEHPSPNLKALVLADLKKKKCG